MYTIVWFVLLIVFIVAEASTVSMVSAWFAIGALAAMICSFLDAQFWLQVVAFVVASGASLAMLRPIAKKHFNAKRIQTNVDALVGRTCLVTVTVDNLQEAGQIKLGDVEWSARSSADERIEVGTQVRIDRVEGVKVFVTPVKVEVG